MNYLLVISLLISSGLLAGFLAGLLGIGGGIILVPSIYYILEANGYQNHSMHIAVGTSLLSMVQNSMITTYRYHKAKILDRKLLSRFTVGIVLGSALGITIANSINMSGLKFVFAFFQLIFSIYMTFFSEKYFISNRLPSKHIFNLIATFNACIATLMGAGGASQNVIFMTLYKIEFRKALAVATAIGSIMAAISSFGFLLIGINQNNLPPYSIGYINIPILILVCLSSVLSISAGIKLSFILSVKILKKIFTIFICIISVKMMSEIFINL